MRCHEILNIAENATVVEIEEAYKRKSQNLENGKGVLLPESIEIKQKELTLAKEECLSWEQIPPIARMKKRVTESFYTSSGNIRLNEVCIGPCTFTDMCGGVCCRGCYNDGTESLPCTEACFGFQYSILCDLGCWAIIAMEVVLQYLKDKKKNEKDKLLQEAKSIEEENEEIRKELSQWSLGQAELRNQVSIAENRVHSVEPYLIMFTEFGASDGQVIIEEPRKELEQAKARLSDNQNKENDLKNKIRSNQEIIDDINRRLRVLNTSH